jgi:cytochrome P450
LKRWSDGFQGLIGSRETTPEQIDRFLTTTVEFSEYAGPLIEERRRRPTDDLKNDTTAAALAGLMLYLVRLPDLQNELRADAALIPGFVEEGLRLVSPAQGLFRTATTNTEVRGVKIAKGDHLLVRYGAACRDGAQYEQPLACRLDREDLRHLAFGRGTHACPGAALSRLELQIALETLLARTASITLSDREQAVVPFANVVSAKVSEIYLDIVEGQGDVSHSG